MRDRERDRDRDRDKDRDRDRDSWYNTINTMQVYNTIYSV